MVIAKKFVKFYDDAFIVNFTTKSFFAIQEYYSVLDNLLAN